MTDNNAVPNCTGSNADNPECECYKPKSYYAEKLADNFKVLSNEKLKENLVNLASEARPFCMATLPCYSLKYRDYIECSVNVYNCLANTKFINDEIFVVNCPEKHSHVPCEEFKAECGIHISDYLYYEFKKISGLEGKAIPRIDLFYHPSKASTHYTNYTNYTNETSKSQSKSTKKKSSTGEIIGIIFAVILVFIVIGVVVYYVIKKREEKSKHNLLTK